jgi:preprotein translocase subunit SecF
MAKNCPTRQLNLGASQQQRSQGQQNFTYSKVNHVTAEEAQQSKDVVLRMFLSNSHPATVLFDFGASHSFISSKLVAKYNLKYTMIVSSSGGEMKTKHMCLAISIAIRGVLMFCMQLRKRTELSI